MAHHHCMGIYCADVEIPKDCKYIDDLVIICVEDRIEYYNKVLGWFAAAWDGIVTLGIETAKAMK